MPSFDAVRCLKSSTSSDSAMSFLFMTLRQRQSPRAGRKSAEDRPFQSFAILFNPFQFVDFASNGPGAVHEKLHRVA